MRNFFPEGRHHDMSFTIWFTGLSGAGKTTLSKAVYLEVRRRGLAAEWLDGDIIRSNFSQELTFSRRDRDINVGRIGFVSHLLNKNNVVSVVAAIAPYEQARAKNRALLGNYVEVFVDCPLDVVARRDVKGLYARALAGEIENFTGVSDPYEPPVDPEVVAHTDVEDVDASVRKVICHLEAEGHLPGAGSTPTCSFCEEDELRWRKRLAELGFAKNGA